MNPGGLLGYAHVPIEIEVGERVAVTAGAGACR